MTARDAQSRHNYVNAVVMMPILIYSFGILLTIRGPLGIWYCNFVKLYKNFAKNSGSEKMTTTLVSQNNQSGACLGGEGPAPPPLKLKSKKRKGHQSKF